MTILAALVAGRLAPTLLEAEDLEAEDLDRTALRVAPAPQRPDTGVFLEATPLRAGVPRSVRAAGGTGR